MTTHQNWLYTYNNNGSFAYGNNVAGNANNIKPDLWDGRFAEYDIFPTAKTGIGILDIPANIVNYYTNAGVNGLVFVNEYTVEKPMLAMGFSYTDLEALTAFPLVNATMISAAMEAGSLARSTKLLNKVDDVSVNSKKLYEGTSGTGLDEFGVPNRFSRLVSKEDAIALKKGETIDLAGDKGAGFIGNADELKHITTSNGMKDAMVVTYKPDYLLEFQLKDKTGLQNLLQYDDPLFRPGGKTLKGYYEVNLPGLDSRNIRDWTLRKLTNE